MSPDWPSALVTVIVGVAGVTGTWLAGRSQGKAALDSARIAADSAQALAQDDRTQKRIETTYRDLDRNLSIIEALLRRLTPDASVGEWQDLETLSPDHLPPSTLEVLDQGSLISLTSSYSW
jgi:hypothetical protein